MSEYFKKPIVKTLMLKGQAGQSIKGIKKTGTNGFVDTYTITLTDGTTSTFTVTNGREISSISKTGTRGLVDTYTIKFNDDTTSTFTVTNGKDGDGLNNMQVDGRNLMRSTKTFKPQFVLVGASATLTKDVDGFCYTSLRDNFSNYIHQSIDLISEKTYTISFYAKCDLNSGMDIKDDKSNVILGSVTINSKDWKFYSITFVIEAKDHTPKIAFVARQNSANVLIKKIKLELGSKATDWTPAPEDLAMEAELAMVAKGESDCKQAVDALGKRIDNLILSSGSESSAEVIDARTGHDGKVYNTLGKAIREQVNDINKTFGDDSNIDINESGYISTTDSVLSLEAINNSAYRHKILECSEGDLFTITSDSGVGALPYTFIDANNFVLDQSKTPSVNNVFIVAPKNTKKVIFNTGNIPEVSVKHGWTSVQKALSYTNNLIEKNKEEINNINKLTYSLKNNLKDEFNKITYPFDVIKNGVSDLSSYGKDNVIYKMNVGDCNKLHGYFEFKFTEKIPYSGLNNPFNLFTFGAYTFKGSLYLNDFDVNNGKIYRTSSVLLDNAYIGSESKQYSVFTTKSIIGKDSFYVQYNGSLEDVTMELSDTIVTFRSGESVLNTITFNPDDSVDSLIEKLKALPYIDASFVNTLGMKCSDLVRQKNLLIPLVYTFDSQIDKPRIYIPYDLDEDWHTVEFIYDKDKLISYFALDGLTVENKVSIKSFGTYEDGILQIGGKFNGHESPIQIRNLELDINSYGDCEIVDSVTYPYKQQKQLISKHNPRLIIYEGHGIDNINDTNAPTSDDMACSTDRLLTVFKTLTNKGYVPVTYEQIKDWKINNRELPKRCFNLMFDDYQIENYMNIAKRYPFMKYNIKAGLAIISDSKKLTDIVEIDGTSYTIDEVFKVIKNGGWHTCSHTNSHFTIDSVLPSQLPQKLKECVISCDKHNINSDIIVYPLGKVSSRSLSALEHSDFALGINIATDRYNCRALPDMNLTRVEIGSRTSIENVLSTIV